MTLRTAIENVVVGLIFSLVLFGGGSAFAQGDSRFSGTVVDPSGAIVPGATVVVTNDRTGEAREAVSNAQGRWIVTGLRPSTYTIRVNLESFAPLEYPGMQLNAGQDFELDLALQTAGVTETVNVEAESPILDTNSASIGVNVTEREVLELPVNGRQMSQLMLQSPGSQNAGTGTWNDVRFSGRANQQNVIKFDGVEGSAIIDASPGNIAGQIASPFKLQASLENVQEFRVESNNYPAEYGTGTGGQVNVVTKSGANLFSGSVFEYYRNEALDAANYFDSTRNTDGSVIQELPKSELGQHQFGGSLGGPIVREKVFFFGSFEGYDLNAGVNFVEAAPSEAAWARATPEIAALRPAFTAPGSVVLPGASNDANFDIYQLQGLEEVNEKSFSVRVDGKIGPQWSSYVRYFRDAGDQIRPEGVSGRVVRVENQPTNLIWNLQGIFANGFLNESKIGYNSPDADIAGTASTPTLNDVAISLTNSVANTGIAGQTGNTGVVVPGGLVRASSATNGRHLFYQPYSLAFSNAMSGVKGNHLAKFGGEVRLVRNEFDQQGGTTYSFANVNDFMANRPSQIQYAGDISAPSVFNNGATGPRHTSQEYYVFFAQDNWQATSNLTINYGLRYEYYTPLEVRDDLYVKVNIENGTIEPSGTPLHGVKKDNFQPRVSMAYAPGRTVFRTGFGVFVGPGQGEDLIQPIESDRVGSTISSGALLRYPLDSNTVITNFVDNPNNRSYQPRAYAAEYNIPEKIYQYTASVQRELGGGYAATAAYVGSQGRNLFLRSVGNQLIDVVTNPNPANAAFQIREFSIVTRDANGNVTGVQQPYAEIDFKTSGGHDNYNAMMLSLNRRSARGFGLNFQYTLGRSRGTSGGSNEANTAGNNARTEEEFEYENGYNNFDVRHTFSASVLYSLPFGNGRAIGGDWTGAKQALLGGWEAGGLFNARSGLPVPVQISRPDFLYVDAAGNYFTNPLAGRIAVINTPGGGNSRNTRRPDVVPGVDPFINDGGLLFLNPAAFSVPMPGTFGNLERNTIHGPNFSQLDVFFSKRFAFGTRQSVEFRTEVFNLFNQVNFALPVGLLPQAIGSSNTTTVANNTLQPGQAYSEATAGTFGRLTSTVGRTVGLGTGRQVQFALRLSF
jgi:carboxypeptidase family protein